MTDSVPSTETEVPVSTPEPTVPEAAPESPAPKAAKSKPAPKPEKSKPAKAKPSKTEKPAAKSAAKSAPAKKAAKSEPKTPRSADGPTGAQIRVLKSLVKKPLTGKEISDATGIHPTAIGNLTGYRNPEINSREVHKNNLLNRGFVRIMIAEEGSRGFRYEITAKGRDCLNKLK